MPSVPVEWRRSGGVSLRPDAAAPGLHVGTALLAREAALLRATGRFRRPARGRRGSEGLAEQVGEPQAGRRPVAQLRPVLRGDDGEAAADEPAREGLDGALALRLRERARGAGLEDELDPAVGGVDALAT